MPTDNPDDLLFKPVAWPCPSWCTRPAGHPFEDLLVEGDRPFRLHERVVYRSPRPDGGEPNVGVDISVGEEESISTSGTGVERGPVSVWLYADTTQMSPGEARTLAASLHAAADLADRVGPMSAAR